MNIQKVLLKVWRAIRDFVARHIDSSVARESKKASCAALRSNASKNAFIESSKNASRKACGSCTSRALLSLFVASATLLATFVIAPTSALSAGEGAGANTVSTENTGDAKSDSAKTEGEQKQQPEQSESNNTEHDKKNTGSSSTLTNNNNNKESNPVEKQNPDSNKVDDKAKADEAAVKKNARDAKNKAADSAEAVNGTDRSTKEKTDLPEECKSNMKEFGTLATCYAINYSRAKLGKNYTQVNHILTPTIKVAGKSQKKFALPGGAWLEIGHKDKADEDGKDGYDLAFFKDKDGNYIAKSTKNIASDGSIRFFANKWLVAGKYKFTVAIHYTNGSESKAKKITVELNEKYLPKVKPGDLTLSVYDFVKEQDGVAVSGNKITIKPKSSSQGASEGTAGSDDNKDPYDLINNKLFIESQSKDKIGFIYHHMICKTGSDNNASYTVDSVNGLSLGAQTQFEHKENLIRPTDGTAKDSAVYENDPYTERSQSWITGKPQNDGTFECKVFAVKDVELKRKFVGSGGPKDVKHEYSTVSKEFNSRVEADKKSLFDKPEQNIVEDKWTNKASIKQGVDWDYKSVTIEVKSSSPPKPEPPKISDKDLTLKVYPFKNSDGSLPTALSSSNNKISAILGMSLKPFVDATSAADSANKITLRVLCSKGEKKKDNAGGGASTGGAVSAGSGSAGSGSNGGNADAGSPSSAQSGSQPAQPSESSQPAEDPEYKTWSSNLAELGLSVPADDNQNRCKKGDKDCNAAAQTSMEVSIKPTKVGNYQCVVFALKNDALNKFDTLTGNTTQSSSLMPTSISSNLTSASFKENKDFATFAFNLHSVSKFTLPDTGGQSWNLQLGILAALLVNLLAAGFVVSQSERGRKLILGRWRGLCNHV